MEKDDYQKWLEMVKEETGDSSTKGEKKEEPANEIQNSEKIEIETKVKEEKTEQNKDETRTPEEDEEKKKFDPLVEQFYSEIDDIKTESFKTNSKDQLDRLLRPGSTYFNLNPFEVLQIDPYCSVEEMRKKYRKLSMYVHPDKNRDDKERADIAFEAVNRAYKMLDDEKERKKCLEVVEEARERVDKTCEEKRKKVRREAIAAAALEAEKSKHKTHKGDSKPVSTAIEEDDPDKYRYAIYVMTCKLFADIERLKVREREKQAEEKKRKADEKADDEVKTKQKKEWDKNYEESRQGRVSSWQNFAKKSQVKTVSKTKPGLFFKPPKHKPESR